MNKFLQIILLIILILILSFLYPKGDVDQNGKLELYDLVLVKRYLLGYDDNLSSYQLFLSDMNNDKQLTNEDFILLKSKLLNLE